MSMVSDPPAASFSASGGSTIHKLINGTSEKLVFKVKSSNNTDYRISPVFGFVDVTNATNLSITRLTGSPKDDKLVVHFGTVPGDTLDAQGAFSAITPCGTITIPISAV